MVTGVRHVQIDQRRRDHGCRTINAKCTTSGMSEYIAGQDLKVSEVFERADNIMYADKRSLKENPYG